MRKNDNLEKAKKEKNDEFYTQMIDIEKELSYYINHFRDKIIYCNCDDYQYSNFVKYFVEHFQELGIKKIIATCYKENEQGLYFQYDGTTPEIKNLNDNGDFRSEECCHILENCDIVVTNPPFSLFKEYVQLLIKYNKQFLIIGNQNAITYRDIFLLIKNNKLWLGITMDASNRWFQVPSNYMVNEKAINYKEENGKKYFFVSGVVWFTNMEHNIRNSCMTLQSIYQPDLYPKYDNTDIIEVSRTKKIPMDYAGVMGVPITFLHKYNPNQFEIIGLVNSSRWIGDIPCFTIINGKNIYHRFLIKNKQL